MRAKLIALLALAAALAASANAARAQLNIRPPAAEKHASAGERASREQELERLRADQRRAAESESKLKAEIETIGQDRRRLTQSLVESAARLREAEQRIADSERRLGELDGKESDLRGRLNGRRHVIAELLAALQRIGHRPPPALLVRPEDALKTVRSAILLGAVLPAMRSEAEALAADLGAQVTVRKAIAAEREALAGDMAALSSERARMAALVDERQKRQGEAERALESERARIAALGRQADSLKDLIAKLGHDSAAPSAAGITTGSLAPVAPTTPAKPAPALAPAIAFATAKGKIKLPVNGVKIRNFGSADGLGSQEKGISLSSRSGAQVTAPADGLVVYAGPFRSYGQLLILNVGGGYHVLLAGMERISVDVGQLS